MWTDVDGSDGADLREPLQRVAGRSSAQPPQASVIGGDVVYTVLIDLDEQPRRPALGHERGCYISE